MNRKIYNRMIEKGGRQRPLLLRQMIDNPAALRAWMEARTIPGAAKEMAVTEAAIKRYEVEFKVRCMRICKGCEKAIPYAEMAEDKDGYRRYCPPCKDDIHHRNTTPERELMYIEWRDPMSALLREPLSQAQGINGWMRAQGGIGA